MLEPGTRTSNSVLGEATFVRGASYPLQAALFKLGAVAGVLVVVFSGSLLPGFAIAMAFWLAGCLWREQEIPILVFCILYQWIFVVVGYFSWLHYGHHPTRVALGDQELAVTLSLLGFAFIALGIRASLSSSLYDHAQSEIAPPDKSESEYDPRKLFWVVIVLFSINWLIETFPMSILFNAAQAIQSILVFRYLFLMMLFMVVIRQQNGYRYMAMAFMFVLLPVLTSSMAQFKDLFFMLFLVVLGSWSPWSTDRDVRRRSSKLLLVAVALGIVIVIAGFVWTGGMKGGWRLALRSGEVAGSPITKIEQFGRHLDITFDHFNSGSALQAFLSRLSSSQAYFSRVLVTVPEKVPHEGGSLTWRAIRHVLTPRIIFPEKGNLGGDSWLVRKYANVHVAGDESFTSVGLGYMAEFYIDYGVPLMFVPLFLLGLLVGALVRLFRKISPSRYLAEAAVAGLLIQHFIGYGSHFTKLLGGLLQSSLIFFVILISIGPWLHQQLQRSDNARKSVAPFNLNAVDRARGD